MTGQALLSSWTFNDWSFLDWIDVFSGDILFNWIPEFQYYKNIEVTWSGEVMNEITYTNPTWALINTAPNNGNVIDSDPIWRRWNDDVSSADFFCAFLGYTLNSTTSTTLNQNDTAYYNVNNSEWRFDTTNTYHYNSIVCNETTTGETTETIRIVNNKQIFQQLYDIKMLLFYLLVVVLFFGIRNIMSKYILSSNDRKDA